MNHMSPQAATSHLTPDAWQRANRHLVRKAIAEFSHELLLAPRKLAATARAGWHAFELVGDRPDVVYRFDAQTMALRHWRIDPASLRRSVGGRDLPLDALGFIIEFKEALGIRQQMLPVYLEEISSTLQGAAYKLCNARFTSAELVDADFQDVEAAMTEGHPGFVANNGRLGFDANDYRAYAPETGNAFQLVWLAAHKDAAHFACSADLDYQRLLAEELGKTTLRRFESQLKAEGLDPAEYVLMPVHPWQWFNKLSINFAADIAERRIVCLGLGEDHYRAQQSIRTYFNMSDPRRRYVKTSLSILNMGFMRGLSPYYMSGTPAINDWIKALVASDATLRDYEFGVLREVASVGFRNRHIEAGVEGDTPYKKMLSCLWRESPLPQLRQGERLMSMTALLHVDVQGESVLAHLIRRSGLTARDWLRSYLRAYLAPLLHCFYAHQLVFMPHGENIILVMKDHVPVRAILKDIAEECAILDPNARLPGLVQRIAIEMPHEKKLLGIFIDVFDGFLRHMGQVLADAQCCDEEDFWDAVAECALDHQREHPALKAAFEAHDLFAPQFLHSCLNRLQLNDNSHMLNLLDPAGGLKMAGHLPNPLAGRRHRVARVQAEAAEAA